MFFYFKKSGILKMEYLKMLEIKHPYNWWNGSTSYANVFIVNVNGYLDNYNVNSTTPGLRPISFYNS